ncbi:MAG: single-stranded-DNA-specific exonuclease RecJ [Clostridia bacterium]|nr:single-stranded-DNA-specific exonuclease RecJ [Clostridia bacterium]
MEFRKNENYENITQEQIARVADKYGLTQPVAELLLMRGYTQDAQIEKFLKPTINDLHDPYLFNDMRVAVDRIKLAIKNKENILVFGDYDVDGVTSTYVLLDYFISKNIYAHSFLPNRYTDGYGLTMDAVDKVIELYNPSLIITVDCGISGYKEIEYIKSRGVDVIVTDHHDCPEILPDCPIIDAKRPGENYPFKELCGAGVALKLVEALAGRKTASRYLSVVALATVSDIVPLVDENRAIVKIGLDRPPNAYPLGISMLAKEMKITGQLSSQDVSFKLAPKINAAGRMGDANHSLRLYMEKDKSQLSALIKQLLDYNVERQDLCNIAYADCVREIKKMNLANTKVIVLSNDNWNIGILGIVAARLVEEYNRPTFLLGKEGDCYKGSCRSIVGMNVHAILTKLGNLLASFGGHVMAAGMTVEASKIQQFKAELQRVVAEMYPDEFFIPFYEYDIDVKLEDITTDYIKAFDKLQPFGCQNPTPLFNLKFDKNTTTTMKNNPSHLTTQTSNITLLSFNSAKLFNAISQNSQKSAIIEMQVDSFRGTKSNKGIVKHIKLDSIPNIGMERIGGEYIKQLALGNGGVQPKFQTYNSNQLNQLLQKFQGSSYGTLIVANTLNSYKNFVENNEFDKIIICHEYLNISNVNGYNTLCLCPSLNNDFSNYNQIVLLDGVLDESYITFFNKQSDATIYIPQNTPFIYTPFKSLNITRKVFGEYFHLFKKMAKMQLVAFDDYNYFNKLKKVQKDINYIQFVACVETFKQLGLITVNEEYGYYQISITNAPQTKLENSFFYNKLELILKTY